MTVLIKDTIYYFYPPGKENRLFNTEVLKFYYYTFVYIRNLKHSPFSCYIRVQSLGEPS